jgi:RNA polymerase sigma-70 factor (ECF subfamily)
MRSAIYPSFPASASSTLGRTWHPAIRRPNGKFDNLSEADLVARCQANDNQAGEALIARYANYIYSTAYRLSGNYDDASDLLSVTSIQILLHVGRFQRSVTLPAWIKRIVTNAYIDLQRRTTRRPAVSLDALVETSGDTWMADDNQADAGPHRSAELSERKRILDAAIRSLPTAQREMVTLFHTNDNSYEEIAARLKVPIGTIKSRLHRARAALRVILLPQMSALAD